MVTIYGCSHTTPLASSLHGLPVASQIQFPINKLTSGQNQGVSVLQTTLSVCLSILSVAFGTGINSLAVFARTNLPWPLLPIFHSRVTTLFIQRVVVGKYLFSSTIWALVFSLRGITVADVENFTWGGKRWRKDYLWVNVILHVCCSAIVKFFFIHLVIFFLNVFCRFELIEVSNLFFKEDIQH